MSSDYPVGTIAGDDRSSGSVEKPRDTRATAIVLSFVMVLALVFAIIAQMLPVLVGKTGQGSKLGLWSSDFCFSPTFCVHVHTEGLACTPVGDRLEIASTIGIVSIISCFFALVTLTAQRYGKIRPSSYAPIVLYFLTNVFYFLTWVIIVGLYGGQFCGSSVPMNQLYKYGGCFVLFLLAWIFLTIAMIFWALRRCRYI